MAVAIADPVFPIAAVPPVARPVELKERIVTAPTAIGIPRVEPQAIVSAVVVVAEEVMVIARPREQVQVQSAEIDRDAGRVIKAAIAINGPMKIHGREQETTAHEREIVPEAGGEDHAAGRPDVAVRYPNPVVVRTGPIAGPPGIAVVLVNPAAGNPKVLRRRRLAGGTCFLRGRRFRQVRNLGRIGRGPKTADPAEAVIRLSPITGNPPLSRGWNTPHTAHPDEVLAFVVPTPIAGNPDRSFGLLSGRDFLDCLGRFFGNRYAGRRVEIDRLGEGFVNGAAHEGFVVRGSIAVR